MGYRVVKWWRKHDNMFSRFDTVPACGGRTDVQPISITCFSIANARKNTQIVSVARVQGLHHAVAPTLRHVFTSNLHRWLILLPSPHTNHRVTEIASSWAVQSVNSEHKCLVRPCPARGGGGYFQWARLVWCLVFVYNLTWRPVHWRLCTQHTMSEWV